MSTETPVSSPVTNPQSFLISAAAVVIVVAGVRAAAGIVTPVLLAGFLAIVFAPAYLKLRARRVPAVIAMMMLAVPVALVFMLFALLLESSFSAVQNNMDEYEVRLVERKLELVRQLRTVGIDVPESISFGEFDPRRARVWAMQGFSAFSGVLTSAFLVILMLVLMLLEASGMMGKLKAINERPNEIVDRASTILSNVRRYLVLKSTISLATGIAVFVLLLIVGVDFPLLWSFVAFLLNFVPNIGSILAAIPPVLLAFILDGGGTAITVGIGFLAINTLIGNIVEPMLMGKGVGISPLVVLTSLLFWGWVLGPIGMLLSVPLTMTCKICLEVDDSTRWIAILIGPNPAPEDPIPSREPV